MANHLCVIANIEGIKRIVIITTDSDNAVPDSQGCFHLGAASVQIRKARGTTLGWTVHGGTINKTKC